MTEDAKRPAFDAFMVEGDGKDAFWTKSGAAWPQDDGKGFNLQLAAVPIQRSCCYARAEGTGPETGAPSSDKAGAKDKKAQVGVGRGIATAYFVS
jgi:hypothetical protein